MKRCLNSWDLTWVGFGASIGAGIFVLTSQEAHYDAGPAIVVSYLAAGFSTMVGVFIYMEFAVEIPVAGGSFAFLRVELGDFAAFMAAANLLLDQMLGNATVAKAWTSYLTTLLNRPPNSLLIHTNLKQGYNLLDPIAITVITITSAIAITSTKKTSLPNWIASAVNRVVILFVIIAGLAHAKTSNLTLFMPFGVKGVFQGAAFSHGGFNAIATLAEETKKPSRDIPVELLGSMSVTIVIYCLMALSLSMMQKFTENQGHYIYSVAFESVWMNWAKYFVAFGAPKGMITVLLMATLQQSRYCWEKLPKTPRIFFPPCANSE
ncbi:cationic amino acid transporter 5-like [Rhododendron vialii]|uniref:cationic amino acid transporter 5-like n=1 Tax=Rhododendron vialii TaxID=182163 RepID=UPI0026600569|nr:cationic amino acid transporter 5-like [Rhododendron vialii]